VTQPCPLWLAERLRAAGGAVDVAQYMDWVLHDPVHGAYGSGRLRVGPKGDFATSPSLGPQFAALLAPQIAQWLEQYGGSPLSLIEAGPGEGDLAADLAMQLVAGSPELARQLELVLIEPNAGMAARQRRRLAAAPLRVRWASFADLAASPMQGVLLAHEVLDALPVTRVIWDGACWRRQVVRLEEAGAAGLPLRLEPGEPLDPQVDAAEWRLLQLRGLLAHHRLPAGWTTELHTAVASWLADAAAALERGVLLVVDYALENRRYNVETRASGTLLAYRDQRASGDLLGEPGHWDLTAHLCLETLEADACSRAGPISWPRPWRRGRRCCGWLIQPGSAPSAGLPWAARLIVWLPPVCFCRSSPHPRVDRTPGFSPLPTTTGAAGPGAGFGCW